MSTHRRERHRAPRSNRLRALLSRRLQALLGLGVVLVLGVGGTFAYWTDDVAVTGTTFTSGSLDLKISNGTAPTSFLDSVPSSTLSMPIGTNPQTVPPMVPGSTSAEVFTLKNVGTAQLKYTITGGLTGTDAGLYNTAGSLKIRILAGGTKAGTGATSTCSGGTSLVASTSLTATTTTALLSTRTGPLAANATAALCVEITLDANAPTGLQGKTATLSLTVTGTSDAS